MNNGSKRRIALFLCLALIVSMLFSPEQLLAKKVKLKLNKKKVTLYVGKSVRLKVKGANKKVKWKSSNKKVATVKSKGKVKATVKAKKIGKARITAKIAKKKLVCRVTVKKKISDLPGTEGTATTNASSNPYGTPGGSSAPGETASPTPDGTTAGSTSDGTTTSPTSYEATETPKQNVTVAPTQKATATPTQKVTATPTQKTTATPTQKATATPTQKTTATPTPKVTATPVNTAEPSERPKVPALSTKVSFESGEDGFATQGNANIHLADDGYNGKCLAVDGRTSATDGVVYAAGPDVLAGESYTVQGYVKADAVDSTLKCLYRYGDGTEDCKEFETVQVSDEWVKFRGTFTVPDNFAKLDIIFELSGTDSFYIDEFSVCEIVSIRDTYDSVFGKMGTCINPDQLRDAETLKYVKKHYSSITLENDMKPDPVLRAWGPQFIETKTAKAATGDYVIPDSYKESNVPKLNYGTIDEVLKIAKDNGLKIRYHVLLWHGQTPEWFFKKDYSQEESSEYVSEEVMYARMEMYIRSVIHHVYTLNNGAYKDVVYAWDVANEYFSNIADKNWSAVFGNREGNLGNRPPFIKKAFELAHDELGKFELADSVSLFYNDFNTYMTTDKIIEMIHYFNTEEKVCDGIGMQSHLGVEFPSVDSYVNTVEKFAQEGFEVQITELDVGCRKETLETNLTAAYEEQAQYVGDLTKKLINLQKSMGNPITGLTWWGIYDARSWRAEGHVLMFENSLYDAKPSYFSFIEAAGSVEKPLPTPTPDMTAVPTEKPTETPKYTPPAETAPPVSDYNFRDESTYHNESPNGAKSVVNEDGSITITYTGQYAAFNFYLPDNAQNYYSNYKSVVLTYTSEGGDLGHALYDSNMEGVGGDPKAGKHADWNRQVKASPNEKKTLIFKVTNDCVGGCIRGLQIFNPNEMKEGDSITITVYSIKFCDKENPTEEDLTQPTVQPTEKPTQQPTEEPTQQPTEEPTQQPTGEPTQQPTGEPTQEPAQEPTQQPTEKPTEAPKYTPPAETAPPVSDYNFKDESTYLNESPNGASSVVNEDGSITITYTGQYAAFNFYLPDNAQNYYSNYKSVVLTYTSEGGDLGHALYDSKMEGVGGDPKAGKHPNWDKQVKASPDEKKTLIFKVTNDCVGGCIRGLQIFNPNEMKEGDSITITVHSVKFCEKEDPTEEDYLTTG